MVRSSSLWILLLLVTYSTTTSSIDVIWKVMDEAANELRPEKSGTTDSVTVHVVPHTHNDVGWLKTADQYYYGTRGDIYNAGVQYILDSVVSALAADPTRTFIYVEIAYFKKWWEKHPSQHDTVRGLIRNKQLEFINGGYVMNDEGSVHYADTIDQMTAGLVWLTETFGGEAEPSVAWQIDPFGHSAAHAALSAQMGLKGLFFARMHYQDYERRKADKDLEFLWESQFENSTLFTGVLYRFYTAPPGFCFDVHCTDPPLVPDPESPEYNLPERAGVFLRYLREQADSYRSGHIMLTMGGDFAYQNAGQYYQNLELLMEVINQNTTEHGFTMIYSTPSRYLEKVRGVLEGSLTTKKDDLFPYADSPHSYWTGYFTSRPTLKGYARECSNVLQTCRQIEVLIGSPYCDADKLWLALSTAQHHDAISGTSKQHVADDYSRQLADGQTYCEGVINRGLEKLSGISEGVLQSCRLFNESVCDVTRDHPGESFNLVVYNSKPVSREEYIRVPVMTPHYYLVDLTTNKPVTLAYLETSPVTKHINQGAMPLECVFRVTLPPMGYRAYLLQSTLHPQPSLTLQHKEGVGADITMTSQVYEVVFDGKTGSMLSIKNKISGVTDKLSAKFLSYTSSIGDKADPQPSGAYIFRPLQESPQLIGAPLLSNYVISEQFSEIWQYFNDWTSLVTRVYYDTYYIEVEWVVGPLPTSSGNEVILRYESSLETASKFYTDSNGREMMQRKLNYQPTWDLNVTEPVAGNYYPVNTRAILIDEKRAVQLTVLTDRSQGGASLREGQIELMVHRRIFKDDLKGVDEALNETRNGEGLIAKGKHFIFYSHFEDLSRHRIIGLDLFQKPTVALGLADPSLTTPDFSFSDSGVNNKYINLLTVINVDYEGDIFTYLLRLENILPINEGGESITVDLGKVFKGKSLVKYSEKGLGGDRPISHVRSVTEHTQHDTGDNILLKPLQIRTFFATYKPSNGTGL